MLTDSLKRIRLLLLASRTYYSNELALLWTTLCTKCHNESPHQPISSLLHVPSSRNCPPLTSHPTDHIESPVIGRYSQRVYSHYRSCIEPILEGSWTTNLSRQGVSNRRLASCVAASFYFYLFYLIFPSPLLPFLYPLPSSIWVSDRLCHSLCALLG